MKIRVAAGALLVMLMAPVVASSDEPSLPLLLQSQPVNFASKPPVKSDAGKRPVTAAKLPSTAAGPQPTAKPAEPMVVSIDCDGGGCAVSSGLQVQVIAAARAR